MPLGESEYGRKLGRRHDETESVVQHYQKTLNRVLDFFDYTIHDVINDAAKREHVKHACLLSFRISRDLDEEPWRTEATERLAKVVARRLDMDGSPPGRGVTAEPRRRGERHAERRMNTDHVDEH